MATEKHTYVAQYMLQQDPPEKDLARLKGVEGMEVTYERHRASPWVQYYELEFKHERDDLTQNKLRLSGYWMVCRRKPAKVKKWN